MSRFRVSIVDTDTGEQALLVPGGTGERDLVAQAVDNIVGRGVGFFKTEAQVRVAVEAGLKEVLLTLKKEVRPR